MNLISRFRNGRLKRIVFFFILAGLVVIIVYDNSLRYSDRGLYLVGNLVLNSPGVVKNCAIWKNGVKYILNRDQIQAIFNFHSSTFDFINLGTNGFGDNFPIEFYLIDGTSVETRVSYESTKHVVTLDIYDGYIDDAKYLSTKLTDPTEIELVRSLLK